MTALHTAGDAVLAGLCSAVYERERRVREAAIGRLGCFVLGWIEWAGSEVALVAVPAHDAFALVFRGTEVSAWQWRDIAANLGIPSPWVGPGKAHTGYGRQLNRVLVRVMGCLMTGCMRPRRGYILTGHSMGGALATLAASLGCWAQVVGAQRPQALVTFGAPKSLDQTGGDAITCPVRRYAVDGDPAPLWPPVPGLTHPGPAIRLPAPPWDWRRVPRGLWPLRHHDVDTYAEALAVPHG